MFIRNLHHRLSKAVQGATVLVTRPLHKILPLCMLPFLQTYKPRHDNRRSIKQPSKADGDQLPEHTLFDTYEKNGMIYSSILPSSYRHIVILVNRIFILNFFFQVLAGFYSTSSYCISTSYVTTLYAPPPSSNYPTTSM